MTPATDLAARRQQLERDRAHLKARISYQYFVPMRDRLELQAIEEQLAAMEQQQQGQQ
jgi:hypothetical protein